MSVSISTNIYGVVPVTEEYKNLLKVFHACKKAGVECPEKVVDFFQLDDHSDDYEPSKDGMEIDLEELDPEVISKTGDEEYSDGALYEIDLSLFPENIKKIRITVGYDY